MKLNLILLLMLLACAVKSENLEALTQGDLATELPSIAEGAVDNEMEVDTLTPTGRTTPPPAAPTGGRFHTPPPETRPVLYYHTTASTTPPSTTSNKFKTPPPETRPVLYYHKPDTTKPTTVRPHRKPEDKDEGTRFMDSDIDWSKVPSSVALQEINSVLNEKHNMLQTATDSLSKAIMKSVSPALSKDIEYEQTRYSNTIDIIEKLVKKYMECRFDVNEFQCKHALRQQIRKYIEKAEKLYHDMNKHITREMKAFKRKTLLCQGKKQPKKEDNTILEETNSHEPLAENTKNEIEELVAKADNLVQSATKKIEL